MVTSDLMLELKTSQKIPEQKKADLAKLSSS
jgi:hypothetical protein